MLVTCYLQIKPSYSTLDYKRHTTTRFACFFSVVRTNVTHYMIVFAGHNTKISLILLYYVTIIHTHTHARISDTQTVPKTVAKNKTIHGLSSSGEDVRSFQYGI